MRIEFNSRPAAPSNPRNGVWTDLIWTGNRIIAEVPGSQTATPTWRLLDHEGSLVATTDNSGNINSSNLLAPYVQLMASNTSDPYLYAGLYQDTEYGSHAAWYRNYSAEQARWLRPNPYNGSYDLMNPQSFNRYMYVNGNPLGYVDPSGLANGWLTGVGGSICKNFSGTFGDSSLNGLNTGSPIGNINPCSPVASLIGIGTSAAVNAIFGTSLQAFQIAPFAAAAVTIACSIHNFNSTACGSSSGWAAIAFGSGSTASKVAGDSTAVIGAILCSVGGPNSPGCIGYALYTIANDLLSLFWGPPQFTGSLLPRASALGGLGTSPIGIPNRNLDLSVVDGAKAVAPIPAPELRLP